jgi:hypothetical protein
VGRFEPLYDREVKARGSETVIVARPGYAVAGLEVDSADLVNAVRIVFMRLANGRLDPLDPADHYQSPWIGTPTGRPTKTLSGSERIVVGIHGRRGLVLDAVGLVVQ